MCYPSIACSIVAHTIAPLHYLSMQDRRHQLVVSKVHTPTTLHAHPNNNTLHLSIPSLLQMLHLHALPYFIVSTWIPFYHHPPHPFRPTSSHPPPPPPLPPPIFAPHGHLDHGSYKIASSNNKRYACTPTPSVWWKKKIALSPKAMKQMMQTTPWLKPLPQHLHSESNTMTPTHTLLATHHGCHDDPTSTMQPPPSFLPFSALFFQYPLMLQNYSKATKPLLDVAL